jgi:hypothetical protein
MGGVSGHTPGLARGHFFRMLACSSGNVEVTRNVAGARRMSGACDSNENEGDWAMIAPDNEGDQRCRDFARRCHIYDVE